MTDKKVPEHVHAELLALQDLAVSDIAFYKQQQWHVCNYALALYAAIIAVPTVLGIKDINCYELSALIFIALIIFVSGVWLINDMGKSLSKGRNRLPALRKHFDREISLRAYAAGEEPDIALLKAEDKMSLEWFFYIVLFLSCAFTIWLLIKVS